MKSDEWGGGGRVGKVRRVEEGGDCLNRGLNGLSGFRGLEAGCRAICVGAKMEGEKAVESGEWGLSEL
ncbi:MAG: hypothetical protein OXN17_17090 [Candidatus Poribacteria bacterium]|nr:hypothetical protein [Candidatus Poribacteria bacterium]